MVSDGTMVTAIGLAETSASVTPAASIPASAAAGGDTSQGGSPDLKIQASPDSQVDAKSAVAKNMVDAQAASSASMAQQSIDSQVHTQNQSVRAYDQFSTAGAVFNSRG